jgi:hypothetical protein
MSADVGLLLLAPLLYMGLVPLAGAALLQAGLRTAGVAEPKFGQCWKAYCVAVMCCVVALGLTGMLLPEWFDAVSGPTWPQVAAACVVHLAVVLALLRKTAPRAVLAQACVVVLTNLGAVVLATSFATLLG